VKQFFERFADDDSGQDLIEYALLAALIGLGSVTMLRGVATSVANVFGSIANAMGTPIVRGP
jgi:pilus assembly protein Flp/PilA